MTYWENELYPATVLHWNYRGFTEFPLEQLRGDEREITDLYLKENLICKLPVDIGRLERLESLYLSGNHIRELPRELGMLSCLKCLDLSGNRLCRLPDEIGDLKNLKFLILDDNEISELPLRISELKMLRYLSVCDNKLRWLPQRPVYNYHHCELRFWRNRELQAIPYSLWYHMLREQQTRSLNIGCLGIPKSGTRSKNICQLLLKNGTKINIEVQAQYKDVRDLKTNSPAQLIEICKRKIYEMLYETAKALSDQQYSIYADKCFQQNSDDNHTYGLTSDENGNDINNFNTSIDPQIDKSFNELQSNNQEQRNGEVIDNNKGVIFRIHPTINRIALEKNRRKTFAKKHYTPADLIRRHFDFLPLYLMRDLRDGPISRCENIICNKPVFNSVTFQFCFGEIILIDRTEEAILSAAFCSKYCADMWSRGKSDLIPWTLAIS